MVISFVCLVPVWLMLSSTAVLYHVIGKLQRAYYIILNGYFLLFAMSQCDFCSPVRQFLYHVIGKLQRACYIILNGYFLLFAVPVRLLLSSTAVLYHVIGKLQRAYLRGNQITAVFSVKKFWGHLPVKDFQGCSRFNEAFLYLILYTWQCVMKKN